MRARTHLPLVVVVALGLLLAAAACGSSGSDGRDATPTVIDVQDVTIEIDDFKYAPSNVSVPLGATVTWLNNDSARHDAEDDDGAWETDDLEEDESQSLTFDTAGSYDYYCTFHPYMKARLTVREN